MGALVGVNPDCDYLYDPQFKDEERPECICCGRTVGSRYWVIWDNAICDFCMDSREKWQDISYK